MNIKNTFFIFCKSTGLIVFLTILSFEVFAQDTLQLQSRSFRDWEHFFGPSMEWNKHDGFMLGAFVTNSISTLKGIRYHARPMYAFKSKTITGTANIGYDIYRTKKSLFNRIWISTDVKRYSIDDGIPDSDLNNQMYMRIAPEVAFFTTRNINGNVKRSRYSARTLIMPRSIIRFSPVDGLFMSSNTQWLQEFRYEHTIRDDIAPTSLAAAIHVNNDFFKLFYRIKKSYKIGATKRYVRLRHNAGFVTDQTSDIDAIRSGLQANGTNGFLTSPIDYTYDQSFLGRSQRTSLWDQQIYDKGAGLRTIAPLVSSGNWQVGFGIAMDLPIPVLKWSAYIDTAVYPFIDETRFVYSSGLSIEVIPETLSINLPVLESNTITDFYDANGITNYFNKITWTFNLLRVNHVVGDYFN